MDYFSTGLLFYLSNILREIAGNIDLFRRVETAGDKRSVARRTECSTSNDKIIVKKKGGVIAIESNNSVHATASCCLTTDLQPRAGLLHATVELLF